MAIITQLEYDNSAFKTSPGAKDNVWQKKDDEIMGIDANGSILNKLLNDYDLQILAKDDINNDDMLVVRNKLNSIKKQEIVQKNYGIAGIVDLGIEAIDCASNIDLSAKSNLKETLNTKENQFKVIIDTLKKFIEDIVNTIKNLNIINITILISKAINESSLLAAKNIKLAIKRNNDISENISSYVNLLTHISNMYSMAEIKKASGESKSVRWDTILELKDKDGNPLNPKYGELTMIKKDNVVYMTLPASMVPNFMKGMAINPRKVIGELAFSMTTILSGLKMVKSSLDSIGIATDSITDESQALEKEGLNALTSNLNNKIKNISSDSSNFAQQVELNQKNVESGQKMAEEAIRNLSHFYEKAN